MKFEAGDEAETVDEVGTAEKVEAADNVGKKQLKGREKKRDDVEDSVRSA